MRPFAIRLGAQILSFAPRVAVMVREGARRSNRDAGVAQCREKFFRIADAGECQHAAAAKRSDAIGIRRQ